MAIDLDAGKQNQNQKVEKKNQNQKSKKAHHRNQTMIAKGRKLGIAILRLGAQGRTTGSGTNCMTDIRS
jgi:hypothetical protein